MAVRLYQHDRSLHLPQRTYQAQAPRGGNGGRRGGVHVGEREAEVELDAEAEGASRCEADFAAQAGLAGIGTSASGTKHSRGRAHVLVAGVVCGSIAVVAAVLDRGIDNLDERERVDVCMLL